MNIMLTLESGRLRDMRWTRVGSEWARGTRGRNYYAQKGFHEVSGI
jgi:hypothetical protein